MLQNLFLLSIITLISHPASAANAATTAMPIYEIHDGLPPAKSPNQTLPAPIHSTQTLPARIRIKKFVVEKTAEGVKVRFEKVCEEDASINVQDLKDGGGLAQEQLIYSCKSQIRGKSVNVIISGMVYETLSSDFSDENKIPQMNFFSHLSLQSPEIIFGLGDFNLGNTRDLPFSHLASDLSTDAAGGGFEPDNRREGFTASVRYGSHK